MYPCIVNVIVNDDQQYATILAYLFISSSSSMTPAGSNIGGQYQKLYIQTSVPDDGRRNVDMSS